jgi:toxin ParE1/3/4
VKIIWSPLAIERASEIAEYIAIDNETAALKWVDEIFNRVKQLEYFPESGRHVPEVMRSDIREILYGNYRIIYKVKSECIDILTVRHGKQILPIDEIG